MRPLTAALLCSTIVTTAHAQDAAPEGRGDSLRRRADWRASIAHVADSGAIVRRVAEGGSAARGGLRVGDRIVAIGGTDVLARSAYAPAFAALRGGDTARLRVVRGGDTLALRVSLTPVAYERHHGTAVSYGAVLSSRGHRVRTVVARPTAAGNRRLPAILFIPWLSCDAVERPEAGTDGFMHTLHALAANSEMLFMRVEKPGVGDSEGPPCRDAELDHDMAAFRAALAALRSRPDVDSTRLFLVGGSIGGGLAPILAAEDPRGIAGVVAINGFGRTWYEHMLDIERRILELRRLPAREVNAAMHGIARFYTEYLLGARTPAQVLASHPELRALWTDEPAHQYGRPASYYHAVQRLDVEGAWATLAAREIPALVVWGEYDWIMSRAEAERPIAIMNSRRAGLATLVVLPKTDHGLMTYASMRAAFADESPVWDGTPANAILTWLRAR